MIALLYFILAGVTAFAAAPSLVDEAGYLKGDQKTAVEAQLKAMEDKHHIRLAVVTKKTLDGQKTGEFANALLDKDYNDGTAGAVLLVINKKGKDGKTDWYIATDKKAKEIIPGKDSIEKISKAVVPLMKEKKYADAFKTYADKTDEFYTYYEENGEALGTEKEDNDGLFYIAVIIMFGLSFLVKRAVRRHLEAEMNNVVPAAAADNYMKPGSFNITNSSDIFLYMDIDRTPLSQFNDHDDDDGDVDTSSDDDDHGGGGGSFFDDDDGGCDSSDDD